MDGSDFVVIGSGPGGYHAAIHAAHRGATVTLIEEKHLGGVCLNRGCIPTKGMVSSMEVFRLAGRAKEYGIDVGEVRISLQAVVERRNRVTAKIQQGLQFLLQKNKINVVQGRGRLVGDHEVEVDSRRIKANKIILATGSHPISLPAAPRDGKLILNSDDSLDLTQLPESMVILGGGYIGCEYAGIFSQLGAKVTVVELMENLLPLLDVDLGKITERSFKKQGVKVLTGQKVESAKVMEGKVEVLLAGGEQLKADKLLVCVGRAPNLADLGLEKEKISLNKFVQVNEYLETTASGIYAVGDMVGKFPLAHVASTQARVAVAHAFGELEPMDYRAVPSAVFTYPELASVGLSEEEAAKSHEIKTAKFPFAALGKAVSQGETEGFVKVVADAKTEELLGAHIAGLHASELIGILTLALKMKMKVSELSQVIFTHPTFSEAVGEAAEAWKGHAVHLAPLPTR